MADVTFFRDVVAKSLQDKEYCSKVTSSNLRGKHIDQPYLAWTFEKIKLFMSDVKYGYEPPSLKVLKDILTKDKNVPKEKKSFYLAKIEKLFTLQVKNSGYALSEIDRRVRKEEFVLKIDETLAQVEKEDDPDEAISKLIKASYDIAKQNGYIVHDLIENANKRQVERKFAIENPELFKRFKFMIKSIDNYIPAGLGPGMFGTFAAKTGVGKSILANHCGFAGLNQEFNVTHIISENSLEQIATRYDSRITGIEYDKIQLYKLSKEERIKYQQTYKNIKSKSKCKIKIVKVEPNKFNVTTIYQILNELEAQGHKTELLIIDTPDLMQSVGHYKDKRLQQASVYWEIKILLIEKKIPGIGTTQLKASSDSEAPTAEDLAEAYDKARLLDFILIIAQTLEQRLHDEASVLVAKNRDGKSDGKLISVKTHYSRMLITENIAKIKMAIEEIKKPTIKKLKGKIKNVKEDKEREEKVKKLKAGKPTFNRANI